MSDKAIKKLSKERRGIGNPMFGKTHSDEYKAFLAVKMKGDGSPAWRGGVTPKHKLIRTSAEYKEWRIAVLRKDQWTCQICKKRGGKLQADHIKPFALYPKLRFDLNNGRTLCADCHYKTDTWGFRYIYKNTKSGLPDSTS